MQAAKVLEGAAVKLFFCFQSNDFHFGYAGIAKEQAKHASHACVHLYEWVTMTIRMFELGIQAGLRVTAVGEIKSGMQQSK